MHLPEMKYSAVLPNARVNWSVRFLELVPLAEAVAVSIDVFAAFATVMACSVIVVGVSAVLELESAVARL